MNGIAKRDVAIAAMLSVLGAVLMWGSVTDPDGTAMRPDLNEWGAIHIGNVLPSELAVPLLLLVTVPTAWQRVAPLPALAVALAGLVANELLAGSEFVRCGIVLPVAFLFAYAAAARLPARDAVAGLVGSIAIAAVVAVIELPPSMAVLFVAITTGFWAIGRVARSQRMMGEELRRRTAELREARDERTRLEVATDRVRLSQELDELLQRRLSRLARIAGAGAGAQDPDGAAAALIRIEHESRRTLEDMRRAVGVLRDDTTVPDIAPLPSRAQRARRRGGGLAVSFRRVGVSLVAGFVAGGFAWAQGVGAGAAAGAVVAGAALGLAGRPRTTWLVATAAVLSTAWLGVSAAIMVLVAAHSFLAARREDGREAVIALVVLVGALELGVVVSGSSAGAPALFLPIAAWGAGRALGQHERTAARLAAVALDLEQEQEAHAALSVRYERARIASDLHDIVAHAISVMVVQAAAGQRLAGCDPKATSETFEAISGAVRRAEHDMGRLVALLGDADTTASAPDLALLEDLVTRVEGSGLAVSLRLEGDRDGLPASVEEAAYHVVREGLTNALRYAAGASVVVLVSGGPDWLAVEVTNTAAGDEGALAGSGTGNGLRGLRERVEACGGTVEAGPTGAGGWRLGAAIPRRLTAAAV